MPDWKFVNRASETGAQAAGASPVREVSSSHSPRSVDLDGRFANNGWLQELPQPITKLTWTTPRLSARERRSAWVSRITKSSSCRCRAAWSRPPVWIVPGQPDDSIALALGYGRSRCGRIGEGVGASAYLLRPARQNGSRTVLKSGEPDRG